MYHSDAPQDVTEDLVSRQFTVWDVLEDLLSEGDRAFLLDGILMPSRGPFDGVHEEVIIDVHLEVSRDIYVGIHADVHANVIADVYDDIHGLAPVSSPEHTRDAPVNVYADVLADVPTECADSLHEDILGDVLTDLVVD